MWSLIPQEKSKYAFFEAAVYKKNTIAKVRRSLFSLNLISFFITPSELLSPPVAPPTKKILEPPLTEQYINFSNTLQ